MTHADKMFEELGYKLVNTIFTIDYEKNLNEQEFYIFNLKDKTFSKGCFDYSGDITVQELKAVIEKVKELGWLDL